MDEQMVGELDVFEWRGWLVDGKGEREGETIDWLAFPMSLGVNGFH